MLYFTGLASLFTLTSTALAGNVLLQFPQITKVVFHAFNFEDSLCAYMHYITHIKLTDIGAMDCFPDLFKSVFCLTLLSICKMTDIKTLPNLSQSLPLASKLTKLVLKDISVEQSALSEILNSMKTITTVTSFKFNTIYM